MIHTKYVLELLRNSDVGLYVGLTCKISVKINLKCCFLLVFFI